MFKLIALLLGLGIGFGGGVYWGVHHPDQAASLSATEETQFLKAQAEITRATKDKLDQIMSRQKGSGTSVPGSGFLGGSGSGGVVDADLQDLSQKTDKQLTDLQARLKTIAR